MVITGFMFVRVCVKQIYVLGSGSGSQQHSTYWLLLDVDAYNTHMYGSLFGRSFAASTINIHTIHTHSQLTHTHTRYENVCAHCSSARAVAAELCKPVSVSQRPSKRLDVLFWRSVPDRFSENIQEVCKKFLLEFLICSQRIYWAKIKYHLVASILWVIFEEVFGNLFVIIIK